VSSRSEAKKVLAGKLREARFCVLPNFTPQHGRHNDCEPIPISPNGGACGDVRRSRPRRGHLFLEHEHATRHARPQGLRGVQSRHRPGLLAHGDKVAVIDAKSGDLVGQVEGIAGGTHGSAISVATGQGFTDDGRNGLAIVYDLTTLKITKQIQANKDADAVALDRATGHVFVIEGDPGSITVIDPKTDAVVATIQIPDRREDGIRRRR
jgi:hypothetical protein